MRSSLMATSALALAGAVAAAPASAADMLSLGLGGYMEQWVGAVDRDDEGADGGFGVQSDAEIYFQGSLEADNGLKFTVHVQLEANNETHDHGYGDDMKTKKGGDDTEIDESFARISGDFGTIEIGQRDPIHARTHYAAAFGAGVGLNAGDTQKWIGGAYLETAGWTIPGDDLGVIYITPRVNGVQVGVSYHPDSTNENNPTKAPEDDNENAVVAAGINFNETVGDISVGVSLGHVNVSNPGSVALDSGGMKGYDDKTFTNAGLKVGMGAFSLGVSYATRDDGGFNADGTEKKSDQHDTVAIGVGYTDGPMSLSIGHMSRERDDNKDRTSTMASMGYRLAPGVDWKTSIFGVEDDTSGKEGTAFVTGIDIHF